MDYSFDNKHVRSDDSIDVDLGVILIGMEDADSWDDVDLGLDTPEFIQQHDLGNMLGRFLDG